MPLKHCIFAIFFFTVFAGFSQEDFLAKQYFNDGEYEKAVAFYEKLVDKNPRRTDYIESLVAGYHQLEAYEKAEIFLLDALQKKNASPTLFIELGHTYALQDHREKAEANYEKALAQLEENANYGYTIGFRFQKHSLLPYAVRAYSRAMELNPKLDYNFQLARIYGEQGDIARMYNAYLDMIQGGKVSRPNVMRNLQDFISSDAENENNIQLKKILLRKAQKSPDLLWNELLSWLFVQQKQYSSAFNQEKAIYRRSNGGSLQRMGELGNLALDDQATEAAQSIFKYVVENSHNKVNTLNAQLHLLDIELMDASEEDLHAIEISFEQLLDTYGYDTETWQLQIAYANFLTFEREKAKEAATILKKTLKLPLNRYGKGYVKMALGDVLVFDQKFNEALIFFSQTQKELKNDVLAQTARFKVAQTSFYKGDFDWALTQLKVLRSSTSQLIANDAMQLSLLISDNILEDSTQTALKKYAQADLLAYRNKTPEAITALNDILENHKGEKIEDEALLKQAQLLEETKAYDAATFNYQKIVEFYGNDILADDAHFALGELYRTVLHSPEKAKNHYEKIIFEYRDSYYFPQARKQYRKLRGDIVEEL